MKSFKVDMTMFQAVVGMCVCYHVFYRPQTWQNNMTKTSDPKIKFFDGDDFTCVTFQPDLEKFKMEKLDKDIVALLTRRAYDVAGSCKGVKVMLNGKKLPVSLFSISLQVFFFALLYFTSFKVQPKSSITSVSTLKT